MGGKAIKDNKTLWFLFHSAAELFIGKRYGYTYDRIKVEPPFMLISNHVTNNDPFLITAASKHQPLAFVVSEHLAREGLVTRVLGVIAHTVPRPKAAAGAGAVKGILRQLRNGNPVVLFAEGDCTWDGVSAGIFPATGKLVKAAKVPLVTFRIENGYLVSPRWSDKPRRARTHGSLVRVYSPDELAGMTPEEVDAAIERDIYENVWERQISERTAIRSGRRAERLELALFICPECGRAGSLRSKGNTLFCGACGAEYPVDEYGFFKGSRFRTVAEWDEWQRNEAGKLNGSGLFPSEGVLTDLTGDKRIERVGFSLEPDHNAIRINDREIPFERISDMAMVKTSRLLFSDDEGYHEIKSKDAVLRPYLLAWQGRRAKTEGLICSFHR